MEDDEHLQELWENLLVNATNANSQVEVKRSFASILEDLSPLDATLLEKIYAFPYDDEANGIWTEGLPDSVSIKIPEGERAPSEDVQVSLGNLSRLGCLASFFPNHGVAHQFGRVLPTSLGRAFYHAVTLPGR